ncbi:L,D-transpeptidase family protein [Ramlibacter sp. MMS24-I3-19]|uniref:L,D-transpeptidase family protein n=1 Tax=Ramlibacter sp. MMS24-I3-19 TaxID=3416606 RepID=UPI003CFF5936
MQPELAIVISLRDQTLRLLQHGVERMAFDVSTAARGAGCTQGSHCTPTGLHRVRLKIGAGCASGTVFVGRRATGEVLTPGLSERFPDRDWILTRILWLQGLQRGINRGGDVDTLRRFVYIHGTADEARIGQPVSHGCVRMRNRDIEQLFDAVACGTRVDLQP